MSAQTSGCEDLTSLLPPLTGSKRLPDEIYNKRWLMRVRARCIRTESGCLEWPGTVQGNGYGSTSYRHKTKSIHRVLYQLVHGVSLPSSVDVCHTCDNRRCVEITHLWVGTRQENLQDCRQKNRHFLSAKTHCKRGHEFTPENTEYKSFYGKYMLRHCKACSRGRLRVKAGWPEHLAYSLDPVPHGHRPVKGTKWPKRNAA